jgi:hypothetical protein
LYVIGPAAIADAIKNMGALTSLDLSLNYLAGEYGNDMSGNILNPPVHDVIRYTKPITCYPFPGITALANAIPDMGALSSFTFSGDYSSSKPVTMETTMTKADYSGKALGVSGGMMVAAFLPKCQ